MIQVYSQKIGDTWYATAIEDERIFATAFSLLERDVLQILLKLLPYNRPFTVMEKTDGFAANVLETLNMVFEGKGSPRRFELAFERLSDYARKVLQCVSLVPVGYFTTYKAVFEAVGGGARAVGRVMASNPLSLLVPCHRVVRSDFSLGGYGAGEKTKLELLLREDRGHEKPTELGVEGKKLALFPIKYLKSGDISRKTPFFH